AGQRLEEPDMGDGRGQLDMAHALAAHAAERDFHAAFLADDALELHALVLAAQALIVLHGPEDARAEQAIALGLERAVVDGLGLLDLAIGPGKDLLGRRDRDLHLIESLNRNGRIERVHDVGMMIHQISPLSARARVAARTVAEVNGGWKCRIIPPLPE